jgi:NAD(P)-dependent dehydrogenase (short-subunit alcohol dehydrogenase family)
MKKAKTVVDDIRGTDEGSGHWEIEFVEMDMESLESVKGAAADFLRLSGGRLNLLVNNAGTNPLSRLFR